MTKETLITIDVVEHQTTGLMVATSPELRGLIVHGRTTEEINERVPRAIEALMEAQGRRVSVKRADDENPPAGFKSTAKKFHAIAA